MKKIHLKNIHLPRQNLWLFLQETRTGSTCFYGAKEATWQSKEWAPSFFQQIYKLLQKALWSILFCADWSSAHKADFCFQTLQGFHGGQSCLLNWLDWEMPRKLVKHSSRCVCASVSREDWQLGPRTEPENCPECGSTVHCGTRREQNCNRGSLQVCVLKSLWAGVCFCWCPSLGSQTASSSECGFIPVSRMGGLQPHTVAVWSVSSVLTSSFLDGAANGPWLSSLQAAMWSFSVSDPIIQSKSPFGTGPYRDSYTALFFAVVV